MTKEESSVVYANPQNAEHSSPHTNHPYTDNNLNRSSSTLKTSASRLESRETLPTNPSPTDLIVYRLTAWRAVVKQVARYFSQVADSENTTSHSLEKAIKTLALPKKYPDQFLEKDGLYDLFDYMRDTTRALADDHSNRAKSLHTITRKELRHLHSEIKRQGKVYKNDSTLSDHKAKKEREHSAKLLSNWESAIEHHSHEQSGVGTDPWLVSLHFRNQLGRQITEDNTHLKAIITAQQHYMVFEKKILETLKNIFSHYAQWRLKDMEEFHRQFKVIETKAESMHLESEWNGFYQRHRGQLADPDSSLKALESELEALRPANPLTNVLKVGTLARQAGLFHGWRERHFVFTESGYLHSFHSADFTKHNQPDLSLYLPDAILHPHSLPDKHANTFEIEYTSNHGLFHNKAQKCSLRANNREDMMAWWTALAKKAKIHLSPAHANDEIYSAPVEQRHVSGKHEENVKHHNANQERDNTFMASHSDQDLQHAVRPTYAKAPPPPPQKGSFHNDEEAVHHENEASQDVPREVAT